MRIVAPIRTGSTPVHYPVHSVSPRLLFTDHQTLTGILFHGHRRGGDAAPQPLHLEVRGRRSFLRRAMSETDVIRSAAKVESMRRRSFPARIAEEAGSSVMVKRNLLDCGSEAEILVGGGAVEVENEFSGGGMGKGRRTGGGSGLNGGGGGGGAGGADQRRIGEYYREMLKANPGNPLLLRNYGKFLHEVDKDVKSAEECYERAILESPNDGEVLSLYARLIWETWRDEARAEAYFDRAVQASPEDCYVLGAYAKFLWDAEDEEEEESQEKNNALASALVGAF
ncbi:hypothetical protein Syun_018177 [Stephania yunnanensis]|uniref:TmcB/TmcC TPR repeats domain-containing protein n=1 Tax=Stephania yunnanensis TaxID=152371 RepID=A0AAP0ISF1_9MAGN